VSAVPETPVRRLFLLGSLGLAGRAPAASPLGLAYSLTTELCFIRLTVDFHDRYTGRDGWLRNQLTGEHFCLAPSGEQDRDCKGSFAGSLALARYEITSRANRPKIATLREQVRTIDQDELLAPRPPFHRTVPLHGGIASDVQAFGYLDRALAELPARPWYYLRQDLYLNTNDAPFLTMHWKHALTAIRLLDLIPASGTVITKG